MLIARYTANKSGVVPTFNSGYQYTKNETVSNGIYTVEINSDTDFTSCSFKEKGNLLTVEYLKVTSNVTSMYSMFQNCSSLTQLDVSNWDTSNIQYMHDMFNACSQLTQLDLSNFDTSKVTNMSYMFYNCFQLAQLDVSKWNTGNVTNMSYMFSNCSQLTQLDVSNFDTSNVTDMSYMFYECSQLTQLDVSKWDTKNVTDMKSIFFYCTQLTQLDVSNFDTSNVTDMSSMFDSCFKLTQLDLSNFDTSKVTNMRYMFIDCSRLAQLDVSNFDTSKVTSMSSMFASCTSLNKVIATNASTSTLSTLVAVLPTRTSDSYGTIRAKNITNEITSSANAKYWNVTDKMLIAKYTANKSGVVPTFNSGYQYTVNETVSNEIYTVEINSDTDFTNCSFSGKTNLLTVEYLKVTSQVTNTDYMFQNCFKLTQLDLSKWDIKNVTNMEAMFYNCSKLTQLDVGNLDTSQVTNMDYMFYNCTQLTQLDLSNFDTSKVTNMNYMFYYCDNLIAIGMIYCNLKTINTLSSKLSTGKAKQVYVHDVNSSECTEVSNITFIDYISDSNVITLPVTLVSGDEILWDDSSQRYIIKRSDGTTIQTDITSKFKIDLYTPYTMIYTNNVTSISVNIFRKEI